MITKSQDELKSLLKDEIAQAEGLIAIQAGHFALVHEENDNEVIPAIFQDIQNDEQRESIKQHPYMGHFPLESWKIGVELAKYALGINKSAKFILMVNDWQWVKKVEHGESNPHREAFYKNAQLPPSFVEVLATSGLSDELILPFKNQDGTISNKYFHSEMRLRKRYTRQYAVTCPLNNQCAQEYVPMLNYLNEEKVKLFLSFVPETCTEAIKAGSDTAKAAYALSDMRIVNMFANGIFKNNFWENINVTTH
ncbi:MAG: hypothetical protein WD200_03105 [Candidatus Andersenbacteria bacterium]